MPSKMGEEYTNLNYRIFILLKN